MKPHDRRELREHFHWMLQTDRTFQDRQDYLQAERIAARVLAMVELTKPLVTERRIFNRKLFLELFAAVVFFSALGLIALFLGGMVAE